MFCMWACQRGRSPGKQERIVTSSYASGATKYCLWGKSFKKGENFLEGDEVKNICSFCFIEKCGDIRAWEMDVDGFLG